MHQTWQTADKAHTIDVFIADEVTFDDGQVLHWTKPTSEKERDVSTSHYTQNHVMREEK